jgi:4-cresol dehydrogenase (hydroxylating)
MTSVAPDERKDDVAASRPQTLARVFVEALGAGNVYLPGSTELDVYLDPYPLGRESPIPEAVVLPASVGDVRAILAIARAHGIPLWTVSRGRNFSYGGAAARRDGAVIVDLSNMDSIVSVDETTGAVILEPGVSFAALDAHLRATGSRFAVSVPDLSWGSVLGNALERGFSYTTQAEHQAVQCGMEVVLADGDIVRTGMGALPGSETWALYRGGYGPGFDGLFFQSNFGIVTKIGMWLRPRPDRAATFTVSVPDDAQLGQLVDALRPLLLDDTIQSNVVIGNAQVVASVMAPRDRFFAGEGVMPESALEAAIAEFRLGRWNAQFGLYGSPRLLAARRAEVEVALALIPGANVTFTEYGGDIDPALVAPGDRTQLGIPSNDAIEMIGWRGGSPSHSDIGVVCAPTGEATTAVRRLVGDIIEDAGFDYAAGFMLFKRHDAQRASADAAIRAVISSSAASGFGTYRSHIDHMDAVAAEYSFNDHAALRLSERIKDALDPTGILSPGKQGIWPAGPDREESITARHSHS